LLKDFVNITGVLKIEKKYVLTSTSMTESIKLHAV
jgi:hypothetical protein